MVLKKNNRKEPFDRTKIRDGIAHACRKRGITKDAIEKIVDSIETEIRNLPTSEVKAEQIGEIVMRKLEVLDEVAYIRFVSVYKKFEDLSEFIDEAKTLEQ